MQHRTRLLHPARSTRIEWTEHTWNPVAGCSIASAGCTNCYAMKQARRMENFNVPAYAGLTVATKAGGNGGAKVDHGSGVMVALRAE